MATNSANSERLVPLKQAAFLLGLTPEGLRRRLLNLESRFRRARCRWLVEAQLVEKMLAAAATLGRRKTKRARDEKKPRLPHDGNAGRPGRVAPLDDGCAVAPLSVGRNGPKATKVAVPMGKGQRELSLYDGRNCLGRIALAADGKACAFDRRGKSLGTFKSFEAASAALQAIAPKAA